MAQEFIAKRGLIVPLNGVITGSLTVIGPVIGTIISASQHTGSFFGTASWATNAVNVTSSGVSGTVANATNAGAALTASYITSSNVVGFIPTASFAITASFANAANAVIPSRLSVNDLTASIGISGGVTGSLLGSASWAQNGMITASTYPITASWATTASFLAGISGSNLLYLQCNDGNTYAVTLFNDSGSVVLSINQIPVTGTNNFLNIGNVNINSTASYLIGPAIGPVTGSLLGTASWASNAVNSTSSSFATTSSFAITSSWAATITASGVLGTVSNATSAGFARSASFASSSLTSSILTTANLSASVPVYAPGTMWYDTASATFTYYNDDSNVMMNIGQEFFIRVYNSGSTTANFISNGSAVYLSGSFNNAPNAWLAIADGTGNKFNVAGVATENIQTASYGYITTQGIVHNIPSNFAFNSGSQLWLSTSTSGSYQTTQPTGTNEKVPVGFVLTSGSNSVNFLVDINRNAYGAITSSFSLFSVSATSASFASQSSFNVSSSWASASLLSTFSTSASFASQSFSSSYVASTNVDNISYINKGWDFLAFSTQSANIDGWYFNTGSISQSVAEMDHPGIIAITSSAVINQVNYFTPYPVVNSIFVANVFSNTYIMNLLTGSISQSVRMGLFSDITADPPTHGIYFEKSASSAASLNVWSCVARSASVQTSSNSIISSTASNVWHKFSITMLPVKIPTTASFYIDGVLVGSLTSSVVTGSIGMSFGVQHTPKPAAVATSKKIDYIEIESICNR